MNMFEKIFGCVHDWTNWSVPREGSISYVWGKEIDIMGQDRKCRKCGKVEIRKVG